MKILCDNCLTKSNLKKSNYCRICGNDLFKQMIDKVNDTIIAGISDDMILLDKYKNYLECVSNKDNDIFYSKYKRLLHIEKQNLHIGFLEIENNRINKG